MFFQTVSNSAWANYSYLVAADIDERALNELQILCKAYNIGVIKLNKDNPLERESYWKEVFKTRMFGYNDN